MNDQPTTAEAVLVAHQRYDIGSCLSGWAELGRSHAGHQVAMLRDAGLLTTEQHGDRGRHDRREAQIEAVLDVLVRLTTIPALQRQALAAEVVDAVNGAGCDDDVFDSPDVGRLPTPEPGSPEHLRRMLAACRADLNRAARERDELTDQLGDMRAQLSAAETAQDDARAQGEVRGYQQAVANLRDVERYRAWLNHGTHDPDQQLRLRHADYLEAVGPGRDNEAVSHG